MEPFCILIGAAPLEESAAVLRNLLNNHPRFLLALDGGISFCLKQGIRPDLWLGDMDSAGRDLIPSVEAAFPGLSIETCSPIKDETDMDLGIRRLHELCPEVKDFRLFGGAGGERMDHTLANIQLMHREASLGNRCLLIASKCFLQVIVNDTLTLPARPTGTLSVFSLTDRSEGVRIAGAFYPYEGTLTNTFALGVSNQFTGNPVTIGVQKGALLVCWAPE